MTTGPQALPRLVVTPPVSRGAGRLSSARDSASSSRSSWVRALMTMGRAMSTCVRPDGVRSQTMDWGQPDIFSSSMARAATSAAA